MKKLLLVFISFATMFTLSACVDDITTGVFAKEDTVNSTVGTKLDCMEFVTLIDENGEEVTEGFDDVLLIDDSAVPLSSDGRLTTVGEYPISYKAYFDKVTYSALVTLNVTEAVNNSAWVNNGIEVSTNGNNVVFDYVVPGTSWWDLHAILAVENHPSTHNTLTAVVNGPLNHGFILKVESSTGAETEVEFKTTGANQTITLCVEPTFTTEDIAGINQVIFFNNEATSAGTLTMSSFGFSSAEVPEFEPSWSFWGGVYQDEKGNVVFPQVSTGAFWDLGAIYQVNGFADTQALRLEVVIEEGHEFILKLETSTGVATGDNLIVGTGKTQVIDIVPGWTDAQFRVLTKIIVFSYQTSSAETSSISVNSVKGISLDDVTFAGDVNIGFHNNVELSVQLTGNTVNSATAADFTFEGSVEGFDAFNVTNSFWHGDGFIQSFIGFGGTAVSGTSYNVNVVVKYKGEELLTVTKSVEFVVESQPDTDVEVPEGDIKGTIKTSLLRNDNILEVQVVSSLANHDNAKLFVGELTIDGLDNITFVEVYYHGDGYLVYVFNLGQLYETDVTYSYDLTINLSETQTQTLSGTVIHTN